MKRYRYILCGQVNLTDKVSDFRLISLNNIQSDQGIRVEIPDDMQLSKFSCDLYSTTDDARLIQDLHPEARVKINGRWRSMPELLNHQPHTWHEILRKSGIYGTTSRTYLTKDKYKAYCENLVRNHEF